MTSERAQRRIDSLLDQADEAIAAEDWQTVAARCRAVLALDAENDDARGYLAAVAKKLRLQGAADADSDTSLVSLTRSIEADRPDVAPAMAPDGTVTLLFSDIEDSTAHNVQLGDDAWMERLFEHNRLVREAIAEHHGFEVKTEGDSFFIAFGSARDAVRCAQAMHRALEVHNDEEAEHPIRIRVGLHTGEPVKEADDFYGTHVVLASRIASTAYGGDILVSSLLRDLVASSGEFELTVREPVALKGLDGEHVTYAVAWA
jgi:class 3 adenylate cyclase